MNDFKLHEKLNNDCIKLGWLRNSLLLLMNNSLIPWFIIVPKTTKQELYELTDDEQRELYAHINNLSQFLINNFRSDKLNVASIGNIVNQMHVHVIGRCHDDFCWPEVVWGKSERKEYEKEEIVSIANALQQQLGEEFTRQISR